MDRFLRYFVTNSLLVNSITILIIVGGIISLFSIKKEARPPVNIGKVFFSTVYPGASPLDIEKLITIPIEDELAKVEGLKKLSSTSYVGLSRIIAEIDPDVDDEEAVISSLYRAINRVTDLPDGVDRPSVYEVRTSSFPVITLVVHSDKGKDSLYRGSEIIEQRLESLKAVAEVDIHGKQDPVFDVKPIPSSLSSYSVSISDIIRVLKSYNVSGPAGNIISDTEESQIRIDHELNTVKKIENLVVRVNDFGEGIKIRDVAKVVAGYKDDRKAFLFNSKIAFSVTVRKMSSVDTITSVEKIKSELEEIKKILPEGVSFDVIWDDSVYVKNTLRFTAQNALFGLGLVLIMLFIGLNNFRMSFVTAIGLPVAFLGTITVISFLGFSLNMMTLIGIIIVVGMLVDDGIVVAENIYHAVESGHTPEDAAVIGAKQVMLPVIGAVSTSIIAFIPLMFMKGVIGKFMSVIPIAVVIALVFSLFECFFILPNHIVEGMTFGRKCVTSVKQSWLILKLEYFYVKIIKWVVHHKWLVTASTVLIMVAVGGLSYKFLRVELFSVHGIPSFSIVIKGKDNIPLKETLEVAKKVEGVVKKFLPRDLEFYSTELGSASRQRGVFLDIGTNYALVTAYFHELGKREREESEVIEDVRTAIKKLEIKGFDISLDVDKGGPPTGKPIDLEVQGEKMDRMIEVSGVISKKLRETKGFVDVSDTLSRGRYEYKLILNQKRAQELGVSASDIQLVTMSAFEGIRISSVRKGLDDCDIRVVFSNKYRSNISELLKLKMQTRLGTYIPLKKIIDVKKVPSQNNINRTSRKRFIGVTSNIDKTISAAQANTKVREMLPEILKDYPEIKVYQGGEEAERVELLKDVLKLALIAFLSIYMIICLIFNSLKYPFFIVIAIPFGFAGAMLALLTHGEPISVSVLVALVGLSGVVVNDAILLIKTIKDFYKNRGLSFEEAVIEGTKRRLRPIFLTSVTTLAGLFPAAYELFGVNIFMRQMSLVMGWGLFLATILTMFSLPAIITTAHQLFGGKNKTA